MSSPRRSGLFRVFVLSVVFGTACTLEDPAINSGHHNRPNVVLFSLDTTRADHLGCYGYSPSVSPRIDEIALRGTVFNNAFSSASITPVSHASILTGQNPYTHGLRVLHGLHEYHLPDGAQTLAETLKVAGYQTAAFVSAFPVGSRFGLDQGIDTFDEDFLQDSLNGIVASDGTVNTGQNQRRAGETTDRALNWLDASDSPFFLWLHFFDPHDPMMLPPQEYLDRYPLSGGTRDERQRRLYDLEIQYMDHQLGRVVDKLSNTSELENTVIVIVSDHGQGLGDHDWWAHGLLYQEQIRAAMIIVAPDQPGGQQANQLVRTIDIMPTVLDLIGLRPSNLPGMEGESLRAMLEGDRADPQRTAYFDAINTLSAYGESFLRRKQRRDDMLFGISDSRWKYVHHFNFSEESELYDLIEDPRELQNLYHSRQDQVTRLRNALSLEDILPRRRESERMPEKDIDRLRSLGYVE